MNSAQTHRSLASVCNEILLEIARTDALLAICPAERATLLQRRTVLYLRAGALRAVVEGCVR